MSRFTLLLALPYAAQGAATIPGTATQAKIVEVHNTFRCGMCDTPPLAWDAALAQNALDYMNTGAAGGHCSVSDGSVAGCVGNGENMFSGVAGDSAFQWEMAINMWFAGEIHCHNFDTGTSSCTAGHMTQVAWDTSVRIGCASNSAATGAMKSLCMYQAPGNFNGNANYPNHVHKCPVARQYEYYTGAASCCTGSQDVCQLDSNGVNKCGWVHAKATTTKGCPAGSCSAHASCTASPPGGSPPGPAAGPTGSGAGSGPEPSAGPTGAPAPPPSAGPTGLPECTPAEMQKLGKASQEDIKRMMLAGTLKCMPTVPSDGNVTGLPPCSMTQMYDMFMKMSEMSDKKMDDKMMKSSQKDMMKGMTCMPTGEIPTLKPCTSEAQVKKLFAIYLTNPSNETTMEMIMNGTIDCQPTKGDMPKLPDCTAKEFLALMKKWKKQPSDGEMEKMFVDGSLTCMPSNKSLPKPCTEAQMAKMTAEMLQGKGPLASLVGAVTGGGMGGVMGLMGSMLGGMVGMSGMMSALSGLGGSAGGSGTSSSTGSGSATMKPKDGATAGASTEAKAGASAGATTAKPKESAGATTAKPKETTTAKPKESAGATTAKPKETTTAKPKETVAGGNGNANGMGNGMGNGNGNGGDWASTLKVLEIVLGGECLPSEFSMGGGTGGGKGESTKLEKPSKAAKEEVGKLLAGCKEASCVQEAAKALSSAGGLSEKAQKTYLNKLANDAAKDAAKDEVKGCLGGDKNAEQKKACFEAAKQKVNEATGGLLLGNRSDAAKKKVQEELVKEAARDALGDSFAECLKGAGANKSSCLAQISGDLSAAGLEGENPRNIRDNLLRKKLQEADDCTDASCREAAKQAAVAAGMEEREYAAMKSLADVKAAAEIFANCQLAGTEESECVGMAKASWVTSSGAEEAAFTDALEARVKKLGAAIVSGTPVKLVRLARMLATVVASATSCDSSLSAWFATQCLNRAKAKQSKAEGEKAKKCIVVDAKAQYAATVNVDASDDEIDLVAATVATSFEGQTLGAPAARRLADDARRLAAVSETYAAQDVAECSDDDQACKNGEESTSAAGPAASPTPADTPSPTPSPTPTPASTATPTPSPSNSEAVSAAAESSLGVMVTLASAIALTQ